MLIAYAKGIVEYAKCKDFLEVGEKMLNLSMQDLREYRLRYNVSANAIAMKMSKDGDKVSRQYVNQLELGVGRNIYASEDLKRRYLQALYEIVQTRQGK